MSASVLGPARRALGTPLYPSKAQAKRLDSVLETCRRFYNDCLAERKTAYEERGETVGKVAQLRRVKDLKATNPYAKDVHSHILQVVVADLDRAFDAFFRRVRRKPTPFEGWVDDPMGIVAGEASGLPAKRSGAEVGGRPVSRW